MTGVKMEKNIDKELNSKRVFKLITNEVLFGEYEIIQEGERTGEIRIIRPYVYRGSKILPYMLDNLPSAPAAIQIHPMNVIWSVELDEFPDLNSAYTQATTDIILP